MYAAGYLERPSKELEGLPSWRSWIVHRYDNLQSPECLDCITSEPCLIGLLILLQLKEELEDRDAFYNWTSAIGR